MFSMKHVDLSHAEAVELYPLRDQRGVQARYLQSLVRFTEARLRSWAKTDLYDDFFQEAMFGALEGLKQWDPQRSTWFSHGSRSVRRAIFRAPLKESAQARGVPFGSFWQSKYGRIKTPMPEEPTHFVSASDEGPGLEPVGETPVITDPVESILDSSVRYRKDKTGRLHAYIHRVVINGESLSAFAREYGVSQQALHQIWMKCKREIQQAY